MNLLKFIVNYIVLPVPKLVVLILGIIIIIWFTLATGDHDDQILDSILEFKWR